MFRFSRRWLVSLSLFSSITAQAMTPSECELFQKNDDDIQFYDLVKAQSEFITSLRLDLHGSKFKKVMREGTEIKRYLELPLSAFPDAVKAQYPELEGEIPKLVEAQDKVESVAKCFMYGRLSDTNPDPEVLRWRYYRLGETDQPLVGFTIPDPEALVREDELTPEIGYVTEADECNQQECDFRTIQLADIKRDAVRLVYHVNHKPLVEDEEASSEVETPTSVDGKRWPKYTNLTKLTLKRTEEIFTSPEIYFLVLYFKDGEFVRMDTVDIDWATEKGLNEGISELVFWRGADAVRLVLKERDLKIPFTKLLKATFEVVKFGTKVAGVDAPWLDLISTGVSNVIPEDGAVVEVNPRDVTMPGELKYYQKATYMDDTRIKRNEVNSEGEVDLPMLQGTRMMVKSIMYSDTETFGGVDDVDSDDNDDSPAPPVPHVHDET